MDRLPRAVNLVEKKRRTYAMAHHLDMFGSEVSPKETGSFEFQRSAWYTLDSRRLFELLRSEHDLGYAYWALNGPFTARHLSTVPCESSLPMNHP